MKRTTPTRAIARIGLALWLAGVPAAGFAKTATEAALQQRPASAPIVEQRQDVREMSLAPPPHGPATPHRSARRPPVCP